MYYTLYFVAVCPIIFFISKDEMIVYGIKFSSIVGQIDLIGLAKWLLIISIPILLCGYHFSIQIKNFPAIVFRFSKWKKWWYYQLFSLYILIAIYTVLLFYCVSIANTGKIINPLSGIAFFTHLLLLVSIMIALNILGASTASSILAALLIDGFSYIFAEVSVVANPYLFGTWGMYYRSSLMNRNNGFSLLVALVIEVIIILGCFIYIPSFLQKNNNLDKTY